MDKKIKKFDDTEIEEYKFHQNKSPMSINSIDINKIIISIKLPFGKEDFKYFIEKLDFYAYSIQKMYLYKSDFDESKHMYFKKKIKRRNSF